jgi:hypothetical protein
VVDPDPDVGLVAVACETGGFVVDVAATGGPSLASEQASETSNVIVAMAEVSFMLSSLG